MDDRSDPSTAPALADLGRPARLLVALRTRLYDLHLPSYLVFRHGVPHLWIACVDALVRVITPGILYHLPKAATLPSRQHMIIPSSVEEAATKLSDLVNQDLVTRMSAKNPGTPGEAGHDLTSTALAPRTGIRAGAWPHPEIAHAAHALVRGTLHVSDVDDVPRIPRTERATSAFNAAVRLKHALAARGEVSVMPLNPWVALVALADVTQILTDGAYVCWVSQRPSTTGRAMIAYATTVESAAVRLLEEGRHLRAIALPNSVRSSTRRP